MDQENCPWVIVGLGNPGPQYRFTRHNAGFLFVDDLAESWDLASGPGSSVKATFRSQFKGEVLQGNHPKLGVRVILVKPQTFMNLSGETVQPLVAFFKVPLEKVVVVHDEVDIPFGEYRLQKARGHGGHNGVRSLHEKLGSNAYIRLRLGVGRPLNPQMNVADYVLQAYSPQEIQDLPSQFDLGRKVLENLIEFGFEKASSLKV